jgi:hypothetical protein
MWKCWESTRLHCIESSATSPKQATHKNVVVQLATNRDACLTVLPFRKTNRLFLRPDIHLSKVVDRPETIWTSTADNDLCESINRLLAPLVKALGVIESFFFLVLGRLHSICVHDAEKAKEQENVRVPRVRHRCFRSRNATIHWLPRTLGVGRTYIFLFSRSPPLPVYLFRTLSIIRKV